MSVAMQKGVSWIETELSPPSRMSHDADAICHYLQAVHNAEHHLINALIAARDSIAQCEHALAQLADARQRASLTQAMPTTLTLASDDEVAEQMSINNQLGDRVGHYAAATPCLTRREIDVLALIAAGHSDKGIASRLCLSVRTVERHINSLYRKIDAHNKADATAYALRHHLV